MIVIVYVFKAGSHASTIWWRDVIKPLSISGKILSFCKPLARCSVAATRNSRSSFWHKWGVLWFHLLSQPHAAAWMIESSLPELEVHKLQNPHLHVEAEDKYVLERPVARLDVRRVANSP